MESDTGPSGGSHRVTRNESGVRLDVLLAEATHLSRSRAQRLIKEGLVAVDGAEARKNHHAAEGELISWSVPEPGPCGLAAEDIPLSIVFSDEHLLVVDKPAGMVMYPGPGHDSGTLVNALLARYPDIEGVGGRGRPGIFHRLDGGTSGLVAVARTEQAFGAMVEKIKEREVGRTYLALLVGSPPAREGTIDLPMGRSRGNRKRMAVDRAAGRRAVSRFAVKEGFGLDYTLVEVNLETGRTHQIRVHFSHIGHPVAGDPEYSRGKASRALGLDRQFLHACRLAFDHPVTGERLCLQSPLPSDLRSVLEDLRARYR